MSVRDFMRGGYKNVTEPTVITKHGRAIGTWLPFGVAYFFTESKVGTGKTSSR